MTNQEAIKYLQQIYPNGGHCWLDEQRIEAIGMAINALQEEPVSEELEEAADNALSNVFNTYEIVNVKSCLEMFRLGAKWQKEQFEKNRLADCDRQTEEEAEIERDFCMGIIENEHRQPTFDDAIKYGMRLKEKEMQSTIELAEDHAMLAGMEKMKEEIMENIWKPADGNDLPEIDREVIALIEYKAQRNIHDEEYPTYIIGFAHRPDSKGWNGKSISTGKIEHYTPKTHGKGGWNIPDVKWWLDVELPKEIEL